MRGCVYLIVEVRLTCTGRSAGRLRGLRVAPMAAGAPGQRSIERSLTRTFFAGTGEREPRGHRGSSRVRGRLSREDGAALLSAVLEIGHDRCLPGAAAPAV